MKKVLVTIFSLASRSGCCIGLYHDPNGVPRWPRPLRNAEYRGSDGGAAYLVVEAAADVIAGTFAEVQTSP